MIDPTVTVSIATPTLALVSEATWFVDGESRPGVITVHRFEDAHIEITIQPLTQLPYPMAIEVVLDTDDLAHIKSLLEAQDRAAEQPAPSNPSDDCYDCRTNQTRLDTLDAEYVTLCQAIDGQARLILALETAARIEHRTMHATFNQHQARLDDLAQRLDNLAINGLRAHVHAIDDRVRTLENRAQGITGPAPAGYQHAAIQAVRCDYCSGSGTYLGGMCSGCDGAGYIREMPRESA